MEDYEEQLAAHTAMMAEQERAREELRAVIMVAQAAAAEEFDAEREATRARFAGAGVITVDRAHEQVVVGKSFTGKAYRLGESVPHQEQ